MAIVVFDVTDNLKVQFWKRITTVDTGINNALGMWLTT